MRCQTLFCGLLKGAHPGARRRTIMRIPYRGRSVTRATGETGWPGARSKRNAPEQMAEHDHHLQHRKAHADADARPGAERNVGVAIDRIAVGAEKALGIESVGVFPQGAVPMQQEGRDGDHRAGGNAAARQTYRGRSPRG